ncbi:hypothetical protein [Companilactobacillus metriopterae]|uniref:hypothetical protein n=1 Tax=Companilactobacillus metriopterae TaxID=1909267 RepID=UPI00100A4EE5|nr:hypothetical protein [Companilactobacillus metriopterae]
MALKNENLPFYQIATNIFIPQKITNFKDVIVINLPTSEHAYTVNDLGEKTGDKVDNSLVGGSSWQHDGTLYPMKNGVIAYKIDSNLYLPVKFAQGSGYTGR